jgi:hypothetical protein
MPNGVSLAVWLPQAYEAESAIPIDGIAAVRGQRHCPGPRRGPDRWIHPNWRLSQYEQG